MLVSWSGSQVCIDEYVLRDRLKLLLNSLIWELNKKENITRTVSMNTWYLPARSQYAIYAAQYSNLLFPVHIALKYWLSKVVL